MSVSIAYLARTGGPPKKCSMPSAGGPTRSPTRSTRTRMRIRQLALRNFGLYRGEQVFDLAPRTKPGQSRPLVLVGGHNGAGKTTVLDAVRVCLYGRLALGPRITETEYQAYLRDRIHRSREVLIPVSYASVAMEFDYAHAGKQSTYLVHRAWET